MSSPNLPPNSVQGKSQDAYIAKAEQAKSPPPGNAPVAIPLGEQVKRGWDWVVFVWRTIRRIGGPLDLLLAIWTILSLLIHRFLVQLGVRKS